MEKIQKYSKALKIIFQFMLVFVVLLPALGWILYPAPSFLRNSLIGFGFSVLPDNVQILYPITWKFKITGLFLEMIPTAFLAFVMMRLIQLFSTFEKGHIFEINNVKIIRSIGIALLINQFLNPIVEAFQTGILTSKNPPGHGIITMTMDGTHMFIVVVALVTLSVSWIFLEAVKLRDENRQFV